MLACTACGRAWNARVLDPVWLTSATCPACQGELTITSHRPKPITAGSSGARFPRERPQPRLAERLTGLGG